MQRVLRKAVGTVMVSGRRGMRLEAHFSSTGAVRGLEEFFPRAQAPGSDGPPPTTAGRAWRASELRLKGYDDLHGLWFVLLKERNMLETERIRARKRSEHMENPARLRKVRQSMSRLKTVLRERKAEEEERAKQAVED